MDISGPAIQKARTLISSFKGESYVFGKDCLGKVGKLARSLGSAALIIANKSVWLADSLSVITQSLNENSVKVLDHTEGSRPNTPIEDVMRIRDRILEKSPELLVAVGGGSTIDAVKAAAVFAAYGSSVPDVSGLFGVGTVTDLARKTGVHILPIIAVQTAASSASHLTKYANVTDLRAGMKYLIVDQELVPPKAVFDYTLTCKMGRELTIDGALDGLSHAIEVYYGSGPEPPENLEKIALTATSLIVQFLPQVLENPADLQCREALAIATDLGGIAIMLGATNGGHLTSFSLVDVLAHGRACGLVNPYFTVFFAPAIERQLRRLGQIFKEYMEPDATALLEKQRSPEELSLHVAKAMLNFLRSLGVPTKLSDVPGYSKAHFERIVSSLGDPKFESKLKSMPVALDISNARRLIPTVIKAAETGDFSLIKYPGF